MMGMEMILKSLKLFKNIIVRGTQRQFSENICSENDLRSRIFGTFVTSHAKTYTNGFPFSTVFRLQAVCQPFERLGYPLARNVNPFERLGHPFVKNINPFERLGYPFVEGIRPCERLHHACVKDNRPSERLGHSYYDIP